MNAPWQSSPITVDGIEIRIHAISGAVTESEIVDGVSARDLLLTPSQARAKGHALIEGADKAEGRK